MISKSRCYLNKEQEPEPFSSMGHTPLVGYGLGLGGNGRTFLGSVGEELLKNAYAELD